VYGPEARREAEAPAVGQLRYVDTVASEGSFQLAQKNELANLYIDSEDWAGVIRAAGDLQADIKRVTDRTAKITHNETELGKNAVLIGTIGKSKIIDQLVKDGKIDAAPIAGKWNHIS